MPTYRTDVFVSEPMAAYKARRAEYLTSHQLADFRACPLLYRKTMAGLVGRTFGDALAVGAAAHTMALEGRAAFEREYVVGGPVNPKTQKPYGPDTKKFAAWAKSTGKTALSDGQFALVCQLASSVRLHPVAAQLLKVGIAEGVLRSEYGGVKCQIRADWLNPEAGLVDLKTCANLDFVEAPGLRFDHELDELVVLSDVKRFHYAEQLAFYRGVYRQATGVSIPVYLIRVEKREPYRCGVWQFSDAALDAAERRNIQAIGDLIACRRDNSWPTNFEELRTIAA